MRARSLLFLRARQRTKIKAASAPRATSPPIAVPAMAPSARWPDLAAPGSVEFDVDVEVEVEVEVGPRAPPPGGEVVWGNQVAQRSGMLVSG